MVQMKAIQITEDNHSQIEFQHELEEDALKDLIGYWVVKGFGDSRATLGYLSTDEIKQSYEIARDLQNDYVELTERPPHFDDFTEKQ